MRILPLRSDEKELSRCNVSSPFDEVIGLREAKRKYFLAQVDKQTVKAIEVRRNFVQVVRGILLEDPNTCVKRRVPRDLNIKWSEVI